MNFIVKPVQINLSSLENLRNTKMADFPFLMAWNLKMLATLSLCSENSANFCGGFLYLKTALNNMGFSGQANVNLFLEGLDIFVIIVGLKLETN